MPLANTYAWWRTSGTTSGGSSEVAAGGVVGAVESVEVAAKVSPAVASRATDDEHGKPRRAREESRSHGVFLGRTAMKLNPLKGQS